MAVPGEELVQRARERVGRTLNGKWYLDALLGAGGMAAVYRGAHRNGTQAAIKVLHPELSHDISVRRRFFQEGFAANAVHHDGAVTVLDDGESDEGELYLVMELLSGMSIQTRWEKLGRRFSTKEALSVAHSVLDILAAAHDKGILHRDVKPENVFVTKDKRIKLLDFGLARLREARRVRRPPKSGADVNESADDDSSFETPATSDGQLIGTVSYMPPEQALARVDEVDARSDVWAVGATVFTLLAGRTVHEATTPHEHLMLAATQAAPRLASVTHQPKVVCNVVDRALEFRREDRWPDARSMQQAVERAYRATEKERGGEA